MEIKSVKYATPPPPPPVESFTIEISYEEAELLRTMLMKVRTDADSSSVAINAALVISNMNERLARAGINPRPDLIFRSYIFIR